MTSVVQSRGVRNLHPIYQLGLFGVRKIYWKGVMRQDLTHELDRRLAAITRAVVMRGYLRSAPHRFTVWTPETLR